MNIYQLQSVIPAKGERPKRAPLLESKSSAKQYLAGERFRGQPFPDDWTKAELHFGSHVPWKADFYFYGPGGLVCSERAMDALAPLEDEGEFLPVRLTGMRGSFFLYNSTNCRSYLNARRTTWKQGNKETEPARISNHAFWIERIGDDCLFKLLEEGAVETYCIELTDDPDEDEFKSVVRRHKLTGLAFKLVWSNK